MQPLVSILFPCYNAELFLKYSLESILNQDYKNLEIICINDGSSDSTLDILHSYQKNDNRIVVVDNKKNLGLIATLNKALSYVKGEFFARMDADDFSSPTRINEEVAFLLQNPTIDIVSTAYSYFNKDYRFGKHVSSIATLPNALKFLSLFCAPLTHASILAKSSLIHNGSYKYNIEYPHAEDFELFSRLAWQNVTIANINKALYHIRLHSDSVSAKFSDLQFNTNKAIVKRNFNHFDSSIVIDDDVAGILACKINFMVTYSNLFKALLIIKDSFSKYKLNCSIIEAKEISTFLNLHTLNIIIQTNKFNFKTFGYHNIPFFIRSITNLKMNQLLLIVKKCF